MNSHKKNSLHGCIDPQSGTVCIVSTFIVCNFTSYAFTLLTCISGINFINTTTTVDAKVRTGRRRKRRKKKTFSAARQPLFSLTQIQIVGANDALVVKIAIIINMLDNEYYYTHMYIASQSQTIIHVPLLLLFSAMLLTY